MSAGLLDTLQEAVVAMRQADAETATRAALEAGAAPRAILDEGLTAAMLEVGRRWDAGRMYLPQVMVAARIFARCARIVEPHLVGGATAGGPRVVLATVKGDVHDLGKSIVGSMLRARGFEVHDLGKDQRTERIVAAVVELAPRVLGLSAMLTSTMGEQEVVIRELERAGARERVHVIVGGAPVTAAFAERIGADGYGANAAHAVQQLQPLLAPPPPPR